MDVSNLIKEKQKELDEQFKKEIKALKENKITREEFIKTIILKTPSILDLYYLVNKYIGRIIIVDNVLDEIKKHLSLGNIYFDTENISDITYNPKQKIPNIKYVKKIKKYDNKNKFNRNKRYK